MKNASTDRDEPRAAPRPRWLRYLTRFAAASAVIITFLAVAVLWKPSGADRRTGGPDFFRAVAASEAPEGAFAMLFHGKARVTFTEADIADIGAAVLDRDSPYLPRAIKEAVRREVPDYVETVSGCSIDSAGITIYVRCRRAVSIYVTVTGTLTVTQQGALAYSPFSYRIGLLPVPGSLVKSLGALEDEVLIAPEETGIVAEKVFFDRGRLTIELAAREGD